MRNKPAFIGIIMTVVACGIISCGIVSFIGYALWFRPPPSALEIRTLLESKSFPSVMNPRTGETVLPPSSSTVHIMGIYPYSWGVVTSYYNDTGQGIGKLDRRLFGWDFRSYSWGPRSAMEQGKTILYNYQQEYAGFQLPYAEVIYGFRSDDRVAGIRVVFDDTSIVQQEMVDEHFSISAEIYGGACMIQVLDASNAIIEEIALQPRIPSETHDELYDCT